MIDLSKPLQTCDGREVRIYATDHVGLYSISGAIKYGEGWRSAEWTSEGRRSTSGSHHLDLVNFQNAFSLLCWVNVYGRETGGQYKEFSIHVTKKDADRHSGLERVSGSERVACLRVAIEGKEGDGI